MLSNPRVRRLRGSLVLAAALAAVTIAGGCGDATPATPTTSEAPARDASCGEGVGPRLGEDAPLAAANPDPGPVTATVQTDPIPSEGDAADDPAIWVHPRDPALSTIIGTDKQAGIAVYALDGTQLQFLPDGEINNVDLRCAFPLGATTVTLVAGSNETADTIALYTVDEASRRLVAVPSGQIEASIEVYGLCMYHSLATDDFYVFVNSRAGEVEQWELEASEGEVDARRVRKFTLDSTTEGCVADDELGWLYVGEEEAGIWKLGAEPDAGSARTLVDAVAPDGNLVPDVEGLALTYGPNGTGYLLAASQGDDTFTIYERAGPNAFVGKFRVERGEGIDAVEHTDGIDVTTASLGPAFPHGVFVVQDDLAGERQNFKLIPWERVPVTPGVPKG